MDKYKGDKTYYVIDLSKASFDEGRKMVAKKLKISVNRVAGRQAFTYKDQLYMECPHIKAKCVFAYWSLKKGEVAWA